MSENYPQPVKVQYGSFIFPQPTPYVSKTFSNEFVGGNLWSTRVSITLVGKVALLPKDEEGDGNNYLALSEKRDKIAKEFAGGLSKNYQDFSVTGGGADFSLSNCTVDSISFGASNYVGLIEYSITLSGFKNDKDFYTANYGVTNPTDNWSYSESVSGISSATHTISAKGMNTNNSKTNGFAKAKAFVNSRKGTSKRVGTILMKNAHPGSSLILNSSSESISRFGGTYSVTENYGFANNDASLATGEEANLPSLQTANVLLTYTLSFDENHGDGFITVNINGRVLGSKDSSVTWEQVRSDFKSRDLYQLANKAYKRYIKGSEGSRSGTPNNLELHKTPMSFSISPNEEAKVIAFQASYDNNDLFANAKIKNEDTYFSYNITFTHDNVADIITIPCSGTIMTRGSLKKRNRDNKTLLDLMLANSHKLVRDEAQRLYYKMFPSRTQYVLSPKPNSISVTQNEFEGTIGYSATFSDADFPDNSELRNLTYDINIQPPLQIHKAVPSCLQNGHYLIYDLNLAQKREEVSINVAAIGDERNQDALFSAQDEIESINDKVEKSFVDGDVVRLVNQNKVENKQISNITFSRTFSHEKPVEILQLNREDTG